MQSGGTAWHQQEPKGDQSGNWYFSKFSAENSEERSEADARGSAHRTPSTAASQWYQFGHYLRTKSYNVRLFHCLAGNSHIMQSTVQPFSTRKTLINALSSEVSTGMFKQMTSTMT